MIGAQGFVGRRLSARLAEAGWDVFTPAKGETGVLSVSNVESGDRSSPCPTCTNVYPVASPTTPSSNDIMSLLLVRDVPCHRNSVSRRMLIAPFAPGSERVLDGFDERIVESPLGDGIGHRKAIDHAAGAAKHDFFVDHRLSDGAG